MNTIGVRLRELRQSAKLSQAKIAAVVGSRSRQLRDLKAEKRTSRQT